MHAPGQIVAGPMILGTRRSYAPTRIRRRRRHDNVFLTASRRRRIPGAAGPRPDRVRFRAMEPPADRPRITAIIPIGTLEGAKSRLGGTLDAEERRDLVDTMVYRTIRAALDTPGIATSSS